MEEDKLKDIFRDFRPDLSSDAGFMERLERRMDSVELVHRRNAQMHRRSKVAVAIAAVVGFAVGVVFSYAIPVIVERLSALSITLPRWINYDFGAIDYMIPAWLIAAGASTLAALKAYEVSLSIMKSPGDDNLS